MIRFAQYIVESANSGRVAEVRVNKMASGGLLDFAKLTGSANYDNWAFRVKNALKFKDLWKNVSGDKEADPKRDDVIALSCDDIVTNHILECKSAKHA